MQRKVNHAVAHSPPLEAPPSCCPDGVCECRRRDLLWLLAPLDLRRPSFDPRRPSREPRRPPHSAPRLGGTERKGTASATNTVETQGKGTDVAPHARRRRRRRAASAAGILPAVGSGTQRTAMPARPARRHFAAGVRPAPHALPTCRGSPPELQINMPAHTKHRGWCTLIWGGEKRRRERREESRERSEGKTGEERREAGMLMRGSG